MADLEKTIIDIVGRHRRRCYYMDLRKLLDLKLGSMLRPELGWKKCKKSDREQLSVNEHAKEQADAMVEIGEAEHAVRRLTDEAGRRAAEEGKMLDAEKIMDYLQGHEKVEYRKRKSTIDSMTVIRTVKKEKVAVAVDRTVYAQWKDLIVDSVANRDTFEQREKAYTKEMQSLARSLPVYDWWKEHVFEDPLQLAVIVGEAGDLSKYPDAVYPDEYPSKRPHPKAGQPRKTSSGPGCVWKRLGLAVMGRGDGVDDKRQGGLTKSARKEDWKDHGYNGERRSKLFVIAEAIIKQGGHPYKVIYDRRKEHERKQAEKAGLIVAPSADIPDGKEHLYMSHGHIDKRAKRYMTKRLLKDLWKAWRRAMEAVAERPMAELPAAPPRKKAA